jgi:hypothetical protein
MTNYLFSNYLGLDDNQVLKIKLKDQEDILIGRIISVGEPSGNFVLNDSIMVLD